VKGAVPDSGKAGGQGDGGKPPAPVKGAVPDSGKTGGQGDGAKAAIEKRPAPDTGKALRHNHIRRASPVLDRRAFLISKSALGP
jgi:hypothetical protein